MTDVSNGGTKLGIGTRVWVNGRGEGVIVATQKEYPGHHFEGRDKYRVKFETRCSCCGKPDHELHTALDMHVRPL